MIANEFEKWAKECGVKSCPLSVVTFLLNEGLLDEEKMDKKEDEDQD